MPGPKMGPRPADFDEAVIRQSPTFVKWESLENGAKLRYACRDFVKGHGKFREIAESLQERETNFQQDSLSKPLLKLEKN
mmetsp:Transcript_10669/g.17964  ORF Transcript_10669/g.17964 Transcript_10669/m.17964 type:complete len:80 (+) Transcript_10669:72-311(+)